MKKVIKGIFNSFGFEVIKAHKIDYGSSKRPVGRMDFLLQDLRKRGLDCKVIMDVGANKTNWSRMAKRIYPAAKFCLIEPQLEMKDNLENFCNEFKDSIYFLAGAGSKKDLLTLTIWDDLAGSSFLPGANEEFIKTGKQRKIEMISIDYLIENSLIEIPDLIKLDIQGFELEALQGAAKTFGHTEIYILEVSLFPFEDMPGMPTFSDTVNFMLERGYVVYDFPGFSRRELDGALGQCDVCFVKSNGFLRKSNIWK